MLELLIVSQASHTDDFHNSVNKDLKIAIFSWNDWKKLKIRSKKPRFCLKSKSFKYYQSINVWSKPRELTLQQKGR